MNKLSYILFCLIVVSCTSVYEFDLPEVENRIFCNCLFSTDSAWVAEVGNTYEFSTSDYNNWIENAKVYVVSNRKDTIYLRHTRKGRYLNSEQKPEAGVAYRIFVIVDQDTISSSESSIPTQIDFNVEKFDENPGVVQYDYYTIEEVYDIECRVSFNVFDTQRVMVRAMTFDSTSAMSYYTFNKEVYDSIFFKLGDQSVVDQLTFMEGDTIYGYNNIYARLNNLLGSSLTFKKLSMIMDIAYVGEANGKKMESFQKQSCFSDAPYFEKFQNANFSLLGSFSAPEIFHVYVWDFYNGEYWLQFSALSNEAYRYYLSCINQLSSRMDYTTIIDPVYSNMSNDVGIFAGYSQKMIRIK